MTHADALIKAAEAWLAQDPDPETRSELSSILSAAKSTDTSSESTAKAISQLESRFGTRLAFGTAGLRGELGAGTNRMNRVLVAQSAAGLARFLVKRAEASSSKAAKPSIVIGYDGRTNSSVFASDSAKIFAGHGLRPLLFPHVVPTPLVAFAVRHLTLDAGVVVTASHNPPRDNGYKVYLGGADEGSQIVSPTDGEIAKEISLVAESLTFDAIPKSDAYETVSEEVIKAYVARAASLVPKPTNPLKTVYTPMHGVGLDVFNAVFKAAGFPEVTVVPEQAYPDPKFPTVAFPNPEEPGAMDLSFALARKVSAELIIANDPDADRLAVAIPAPAAKEGWARLTGDQVGLLLGDYMAHKYGKGTLACSIVSCTALGKLAKVRGLPFAATPTGFKFISRVPNLLFGYEEALGYCVDPETVRDKDGITAALVFSSMASDLAAKGKTISDKLAELGAEIGVHATSGVSVRVSDVAQVPKMMKALRADPPAAIAGVPTTFTDLLTDPSMLIDGLRFDMEGGKRVIVRPSGTEPKLKCYLEAVGSTEVEADGNLADLEGGVRTLLKALEAKV